MKKGTPLLLWSITLVLMILIVVISGCEEINDTCDNLTITINRTIWKGVDLHNKTFIISEYKLSEFIPKNSTINSFTYLNITFTKTEETVLSYSEVCE